MHHALRHLLLAIRPLLLAAATTACLLGGPAMAQAPGAPTSIEIDAGSLASGLDALGEQTGVSIMYQPDLVQGLRAREVSGSLTPAQALTRMLEGTGLAWDAVNDTTFVLRRATGAPATASPAAPAPAAAPAAPASEDITELEDVLVVGSRLGAAQYESAQPVILITREDIDRSGAGSIAQVLSTRPEVSVNNNGDNAISAGDYNATTVQLRGMPRGTTLVLVNGRRIGNTGAQATLDFFDLSTLPLSLVDHIEILPMGASAIYGGDALAGVVNIVLKKDAEGLDVTLRRAHAAGYVENQVTATWGKAWERGSLTVSGAYSENNGLDQSERAITANKDYTRFGGSDNRSRITNPGNVFSLDGCPPAPASCFSVPRDERGNLPGLDSPYAGVPVGSTGIGLTPEDFLGTAGILNLESANHPIFIPAENTTVLVSGRFQATDAIELFADVGLSRSERAAAGTDVSLNGEYGSYRVSADNPYNPFGVEVGINYLLPGRPDSTLRSDYLRAVVGARGAFGDWEWEVAGTRSRNEADQVNYFNTTQAIRDALASSDPATALNPFQDGPGGSPELIASFFDSTLTPYIADLEGVEAYVRGPAWDLPAGELEVLVGGEYERQEITYTNSFNGAKTEGERDKQALFGELRAPLLANRSNPAAADLLTLTAAMRFDQDSSFDGTGRTEALGLEYRPIESLLLRAAYNTAFKPPVLYQAVTEPRVINSFVNDPTKGGQRTAIELVTSAGVPPSIKPERGESTSLGLIWSPRELPMNFVATHWENRLRDRIVGVSAQVIVDNEDAFPGRVIRDPATGTIIRVDGRQVNVNYVNQAGVDLGFDAELETGMGTFFPALAASYTYRYDTQIRPDSPIVDGVSQAAAAGFAPRWKGTVQLGWEHGDLFAQLTGRYVGEYRDYQALPAGPRAGEFLQLGDVWFVDLALNYALGQAWMPDSGWLSRTTFSLNAVNLFDRQPDFSNFSGNGYDASQYDIRGRYVSAQLKFSF